MSEWIKKVGALMAGAIASPVSATIAWFLMGSLSAIYIVLFVVARGI